MSLIRMMPFALYESKSLVAAANALVEGRTATDMSKSFLWYEVTKLYLPHVLHGTANYRKVLEIAEKEVEAEGLRYLFKIAGRTGRARHNQFVEYADRYIKKHSLPDAKKFMLYFRERMPTFISTTGSMIVADALAAYYDCREATGNDVHCCDDKVDDPFVIGVGTAIRNGKDKLEATEEMLKTHKLSIAESAVLGNDALDHESMRAARFAIAGPLADDATIELATRKLKGIHINNYRKFLEELKMR